MSRTPALVAAATGLTVAALITAASATTAAAETQVTPVGAVPHWKIFKFTTADNKVMCGAMRQQPGPNKLMLTKSGRDWTVQIINFGWKLGPQRKTSAQITFANNGAQLTNALVGGNNYSFGLEGGEAGIAQVAGVRWMTFFSERGRKIGYTLRGHSRAIGKVAECVARYTAPSAAPTPVAKAPQSPKASAPAQDDDFAIIEQAARAQHGSGTPAKTAPQQASVAPIKAPTAPATKTVRLDRQETLELFKLYMGDSADTAKIFAAGKGTFSSHALNYQTKSGVMGGMTAFARSTENAADMLSRLIKEETASCETSKKGGQMSVKRAKRPAVSENGVKTEVAGLSCATKKGRSIFTYQVVTLESGVTVVILEGVYRKAAQRTIAQAKTIGA